MKRLKIAGLVGALLLTLAATPSPAQYAPRQYYTSWSYTTYGYYYRTYYYKPYPSYRSYNYHYVVYYPGRPYYYYSTSLSRYRLEGLGVAAAVLLGGVAAHMVE